ncbi:MAG: transposase [Endozoicomonadaceae bacterium]|nr:transposase [Endozoicomonadaceae bacterium]
MELLQKKQEENAESYSRGSLSTKIHTTVDALDNPVKLLIIVGQASEYGQVNTLPENLNDQYLLADKWYDSDKVIALVTQAGAEPFIPPRSNRKEQRIYDKRIYIL